jgi:hypothetical protein
LQSASPEIARQRRILELKAMHSRLSSKNAPVPLESLIISGTGLFCELANPMNGFVDVIPPREIGWDRGK